MSCRRPRWMLAKTTWLFSHFSIPFRISASVQYYNNPPAIVVRTVAHARASHMPILEREPTTNTAREGPPKTYTCVASTCSLLPGCRMKFQNSIFEKNKGRFVPRGNHQCPDIDYNEASSSFMCLGMAATNRRAGKCMSTH